MFMVTQLEGGSADILDDSKAHDTIFLRGKMWGFIFRLFFSLKKKILAYLPTFRC